MLEKVNVITLGCSKNLVDSELVAGNLTNYGFEVLHNSEGHSDIVIINTCGFIGDAREESVDTIVGFAEAKNRGEVRKIYVMGCLSQLYKNELCRELPEVDAFFGVNQLQEMINVLTGQNAMISNSRRLSTPPHYAYLKIAEGCNRKCSFCKIPEIRGKHVSRSVEDLVKEAGFLANIGVKELILISQDLSYYGRDLQKKPLLGELLCELENIPGIEWIRLQYLFPAGFPQDIIEIVANSSKICKYIDIPVQHINNRILKSMKRGLDAPDTVRLLNEIRAGIPGVALRTSVIVGYPGETEKEFEELIGFISDFRFDRLGAFKFSPEENTPAAVLSGSITESVSQQRLEHLMKIQENISGGLNNNKIGKIYKVLIDRNEGDFFIGRTEYDSPDVDNEVLVLPTMDEITIGSFYYVRISNAEPFDLYGTIVDIPH